MAESLKDKVAIIGMGCTPFGELWTRMWTTSSSMLFTKPCRMRS